MANNALARLSRFDPQEDVQDKTPLLNLALEKDPALSRFLVDIQFEGKWRKCEWNPVKPLRLNHPLTHQLECSARTIWMRNVLTGEKRVYPHIAVLTGSDQEISSILVLRVRVFQHSKPAYVGSEKRSPEDVLFASAGRLDQIISQIPVGKDFTGKIEDRRLFTARELPTEIQITPVAPGLMYETPESPAVALAMGVPTSFPKRNLDALTIRTDHYWWRFTLANPHAKELSDEVQPSALDIEGRSFSRFFKIMSAIGIALAFYVSSLPPQLDEKKDLPELSTTIQLKKPKVIVVKELPKPKVIPPPKPIAKKEPPKPKPLPKKAEVKKPEKKIAAKPLPKKAPSAKKLTAKPLPKTPVKAPPKLVAKPAPAPKVVQKPTQAPPAPARPVPPAPVIARAPPPPVHVGPTPDQIRAMTQAATKAKLSKSLGFLSTAPSKSSRSIAMIQEPNSDVKYQNMKQAPNLSAGKNSMLGSMAASGKAGNEDISTTSSRNIASATGVSGSYGGKKKGLNEVQGKVSLSGLYDAGGAEKLGSSLGAGAMTMTGKGSLTEAQLQKALSKYLQRFQYCYEKALLSESLLAGNLTLQWTIQTGGKAIDAQVVKSQLNSKALHNCVIGELSKIPFPSPAGGPVTVKYPFAFSSSAL